MTRQYRRWVQTIGVILSVLFNSPAWRLLSKISDLDFLFNSIAKAKPHVMEFLPVVRDWGWTVGVALFAWAYVDGRRASTAGIKVDEEQSQLTDSVARQTERCEKLKVALEATQREREALRGDLGMTQDALRTMKRGFAIERLGWVSRASFDGTKPTVTIRFATYGNDYKLAKEIEAVFTEFCGWPVTTDATNSPTLPQADKFKVVFDVGFTLSFDAVIASFSQLLDVTVGKSQSQRDDYHRLIVNVLPSAHS